MARPMCLVMSLAAILMLPAIALAQEDIAPPAPTLRNSPPAWWGYALLFILLAVVMAVSLMPSKRSHQD